MQDLELQGFRFTAWGFTGFIAAENYGLMKILGLGFTGLRLGNFSLATRRQTDRKSCAFLFMLTY